MKKKIFAFITILALVCSMQVMAQQEYAQEFDIDSDTTILCERDYKDGAMCAIIRRMDNGSLAWTHNTGYYTTAMVDPISPCYVNGGKVYIACLGELRAIDIDTGEVEWISDGAGFTDMDFDAYGNIYSISFDGINFAVHNRDGYLLYQEHYLNEYTRPYDVRVEGSKVYIEYEDGELSYYNAEGYVERIVDISQYEPVTVKLNGEEVDFDRVPVVKNGRTLVPMRKIFEEMGAKVEWIDDIQTVTAIKGDTAISIAINSDIMYVSGDERILDAQAMLFESKTYIPLRAVSEAFGCRVDWDETTKTVTITQ